MTAGDGEVETTTGNRLSLFRRERDILVHVHCFTGTVWLTFRLRGDKMPNKMAKAGEVWKGVQGRMELVQGVSGVQTGVLGGAEID